MVKRGPIPKSDQQRALEGNPSKRPPGGHTPKPGHGRTTCPSWLSPEAKAEWQRVAPELYRLGLLTRLDRALLAGYCVSCSLWRWAQEMIARQGSVYVTTKGKIETRPEVAIAKMAGEQMNTLAAEFGLTPMSRARLGLPQDKEGELDPMEVLLREAEQGRQR